MSYFYTVTPQQLDASGTPYAGGYIYFGEPNVDPKNNPKTVWLNAALTIPAENPQLLDSRGVPSQGTIYMADDGEQYSILIEDALGNQIDNIPDAIGVTAPVNLDNVPPTTINDTATISGTTDAKVIIDSGVSTGSEGTLEYQEGGVAQWGLTRNAIIDDGSLSVGRVGGTFAPDTPLRLPYDGGAILSWRGTDRLTLTATGVRVGGDIEGTRQVLIAGGTFLHNGTAVGDTFGITSALPSGVAGTYNVILDFFPVAEADLLVNTSAELADAEMLTRGVGAGQGSGVVNVYTTVNGGARADATSFSVAVFDLGIV
jgi:hypothetical protein